MSVDCMQKDIYLRWSIHMLFSTFLQLAVGLRDLHQAEKESTFFKTEQIYKMTAKNGPG